MLWKSYFKPSVPDKHQTNELKELRERLIIGFMQDTEEIYAPDCVSQNGYAILDLNFEILELGLYESITVIDEGRIVQDQE